MEKTTQQKVLGTLAGIAVIALGIATLARPTLSLEVVVLFICAGLLIMAVMNLLKVLLKWHEHKLWQIVEAFLNVAFATVIFLLRTRLQGMIPDIFALWILLNSVVRLISSYIYFRDPIMGPILSTASLRWPLGFSYWSTIALNSSPFPWWRAST